MDAKVTDSPALNQMNNPGDLKMARQRYAGRGVCFFGKNVSVFAPGAGASNVGVFGFFVRRFRWKSVFSGQCSVFSIQQAVFFIRTKAAGAKGGKG
ncbi:MAG: hypothetical protein D6714_12255 [Bacteroidetes bacterium]|nr:MAG: hypothetical protein D6714_12255 [Bacteroidota bacterium]